MGSARRRIIIIDEIGEIAPPGTRRWQTSRAARQT
jgi:hypothetical protein